MKMRFSLSLVLICWACSACSSPRYRYVPIAANEQGDLRAAEAIYSIPARSPKGTTRVRSMGLVDLKPKSGGDKIVALHLRVSISNQDQVAWHWDAEEQRVSFPNDGRVAPLLANSDASTLPTLEIAPGQLRSVDLYFPLPEGTADAQQIPEFDFTWKISTGNEVAQQTTAFTRRAVPDTMAVAEPYDPYGFAFGWGGWWWGPSVTPWVRVRR